MPRGTHLTVEEKAKIDAWKAVNLLNRQIAIKLGRSCNVVNHYVNDPAGYGSKERCGRSRILSPRDDRLNVLRRTKQFLWLPVCKNTIRDSLKRSGNIVRAKMIPTPRLTQVHKQNRLAFAQLHIAQGTAFSKWIWSDEKKWNLDGPDGNRSYWHDLRKEPLLFSKRGFGGGSVMVWAAFCSDGTVGLEFTSSKMNSVDYQGVLHNQLLPYLNTNAQQGYVFQHDNATVHVICRVLDNEIFLIGGSKDPDEDLDKTEIFNGKSWRQGPQLPKVRRDFFFNLAAAAYPEPSNTTSREQCLEKTFPGEKYTVLVALTVACDKIYRYLVTEHSLGGALAAMMAFRLSFRGVVNDIYQVRLMTFGEPREGDYDYAVVFQICLIRAPSINSKPYQISREYVPYSFRLVHYTDPVPHLLPLHEDDLMGPAYPFHHTREIWYNKAFNSYTQCNATVGEDASCSDQKRFWNYGSGAMDEHMIYFNHYLSEYGWAGCEDASSPATGSTFTLILFFTVFLFHLGDKCI